MESIESIVQEHPFLKGMDRRHLAVLVEQATLHRFGVGEVIYHEGHEADRFYLIQRGRVALEAFVPGRGRLTIQTIGRGDALGWSWLFPPYRWHFSACTVDPTEAIWWETRFLRARADADHDFGYDVVRRMAHVLFQRLQATRLQLLDYCNFDD